MGYPFGTDFGYTFSIQADGDTYPSFSPDAPSIYIFTDTNRPSRAQASSGSGSVQTISTWTRMGNMASFGVLAIDDPDPSGPITKRDYWIAINFYIQSSKQIQTVVKVLELERIKVAAKGLTVGPGNIEDLHPGLLGSYYTPSQMELFIRIATSHVRATMRNKGFDWALINRQVELDQVVAYRALILALAGQRQSQGDRFDSNIGLFESLYQQAFTALEFEYDSDQSGKPDPIKQNTSWGLISR